MFEDREAFDPGIDSKMLLKRTPFHLFFRGSVLLWKLVFSRHPQDALIWVRSMIARRRPLTMPIPWLTFDAIRFVSQFIQKDWKVFEYGSGHSTIYWLRKGLTIVAVEDNREWKMYLQNTLSSTDKNRCELIYAESTDDYINSIEKFNKGEFDLILVDGSYRRECIRKSVDYLKRGGYLVVDNTDWHWFREVPLDGIPAEWKKRVYPGYAPMLGHESETTIWQRPLSTES